MTVPNQAKLILERRLRAVAKARPVPSTGSDRSNCTGRNSRSTLYPFYLSPSTCSMLESLTAYLSRAGAFFKIVEQETGGVASHMHPTLVRD